MSLKPQSLRTKKHFSINVLLIIVILSLSIFFRFFELSQKPYTTDEVRTLLSSSGYTSQELISQSFNGQILTVKDLNKYQDFASEKTDKDTIYALTQQDVSPPLYFILLRYWMKFWGNSVLVTRGLSVLIGLLLLPVVYWLSLELFSSSIVGWMTVCLIAVSPFHMINSQEIRSYSLFSLAIILSSLALLRSLRSNNNFNWLGYGLTLALGIYSHVNFIFVYFAQTVYVIVTQKFKFNKSILNHILASTILFVSFLPWILVITRDWSDIKSRIAWLNNFQTPVLERILTIIFNTSTVLVDFNNQFNFKNPLPYLIFLIIIYSFWFMYRKAPFHTFLFIALLVIIPGLSQIIPDFLQGGRRTIYSRYLTPSYIGVSLSVAYLFASKAFHGVEKPMERRLWQLISIAIISLGIFSSVAIAKSPTGRTQGIVPIMNLQIAEVINKSPNVLVITDDLYYRVLALTHLLNSDVYLQVIYAENQKELEEKLSKLEQIGSKFDNIFLYIPSDQLIQQIETNGYNTQLIVSDKEKKRYWLYKITK
ncbi:MAG: phospholipid carrier-dependent glycosyltransferase [Microcystis aeruginosa Ma_QC_Ch_20071001_S25]|jgi:hypothetical protein|uniref:Phospholipid carrier-dependent glycosyltransferase n=1 Tax=Microcystis aeruginosa Ma_QC_Ch_20071001_S25D TaxID=2486250 RepID=A0A552FP46_MICAE|nr:glycosyltransferase family 39 protein [Microcystis aeruginosa WS75]TRU48505.1 MAG: phospholipid carrier-dependent glycosyltransferase [Microcystis aeruginosa Ma_QC_Ch_20071001_S25D]TRU53464.1 MAG: phospholipid carrier-dependent glycosyltransferase [Microcystis aeruginosa Ma_QC_Ch_20071001_S25]TRU62681.1 MAG: phospholipid carrier-dependent glycosyltransferase [Microcystis aeruginosa Ma_QC_Ch_20071001_M135]